MLTTLRIKNVALVSDLTLELQPGGNVITGKKAKQESHAAQKELCFRPKHC